MSLKNLYFNQVLNYHHLPPPPPYQIPPSDNGIYNVLKLQSSGNKDLVIYRIGFESSQTNPFPLSEYFAADV